MPFGLLAIVIAPWRIISIFRIIMSQIERVPAMETAKIIPSKRKELPKLLFTVLKLDLPCALMTVILSITLYRLPNVAKIYYKLISMFRIR